METKRLISIGGIATILLLIGHCSPGGAEPELVSLPVVWNSEGVEVCENDRGWVVQLKTLRLAVRDLEFTIKGETHAGLPDRVSEFFVRNAHAHPGHNSGGDVTGELSGNFLLDLSSAADTRLGHAELLVGEYKGMNLHFRRTDADDGLNIDDPLSGHTAFFAGTATKGVDSVEFSAILDVAEGTRMVGGSFERVVEKETSATLALQVLTVDPFQNDTLFKGLDFASLDDDKDGFVAISPGDAAHNILMKTLIRHEHYRVELR